MKIGYAQKNCFNSSYLVDYWLSIANVVGNKYDLLQRIQALTFLDIGIKIEDMGYITKFSHSVPYNLKKKPIKRGYDPKVSPLIYNIHAENI